MNYFSHYPYQNFSDYNIDWLLKLVKEVNEKLSEYLENSVITFADPITWDITEQYTALTCVVDSDGTAYLSKRPVPAGVDISNTNYWLPIFNYDDNVNTLRSQIAYNARTSNTTGVALAAGDLVFWNGIIYKVLTDMPAGTAFIEGTNISQYTVDDKIDEEIANVRTDLGNDIADVRTDLGNDIAGVRTDLGNDIDNLQNQISALGTLANYCHVPVDFGAVGDGVTDDSAALQATIDACVADGRILFLENKTYAATGIQINNDLIIRDGHLKPIAESAASNQYKTLIIGNNANIKFYNVFFDGLGTALTTTTTKYDYMKFTNCKLSFVGCEFTNIDTLNRNAAEDHLYDRFGLLITALDSDLVMTNNYIHDLQQYEMIMNVALPTSNHYIDFIGNRIENITAWSFDFFTGRIRVNNNYIYNYNSSTSLFNINAKHVTANYNVMKSIICGTAFDFSENGTMFCDEVEMIGNSFTAKDKPNWPFRTDFAAVRSYKFIAAENMVVADGFINFENTCLTAQNPAVPWDVITSYDADSCIIKDNMIRLGTNCTVGISPILVWAADGYGEFTDGILKSFICSGNHIVYDTNKAEYTSGYLYGIPIVISNQINSTKIYNNVIDGLQKSFISGTQAMAVLCRVFKVHTALLYEIANNTFTSRNNITNGVCTLYAYNVRNVTAVIFTYVHLDRQTYLGGINPAAYQTGLSASYTTSVATT